MQVDPSHYQKNYDDLGRFESYWTSISLVQDITGTVLEIGSGNGFVSGYLKKYGRKVHTVDYDRRLNPDTVASVVELPFKNKNFDVTLCCQVLEHLPPGLFGYALCELLRVTKKKLIVSLPNTSRALGCAFVFEKWRLNITVPIPWPRRIAKFDGQHYWEIGNIGHSLSETVEIMNKFSTVEKTWRLPGFPYHQFFVLRCK